MNLPTDFAAKGVTIHTLLYISRDENNDITSAKVNIAAIWSNNGPLWHNIEPVNGPMYKSEHSLLFSLSEYLRTGLGLQLYCRNLCRNLVCLHWCNPWLAWKFLFAGGPGKET